MRKLWNYIIIGQTNDHDIHWVIEVQAQVEDSIQASGNQPDPTEVWEAVKRETKVGAAQTRFQTQKYPETNPMLSQGLKLALPGTSSARKKRAFGKGRKNLEHRTFHGLTCVIDHPESWQEDEADQEFAKALQGLREQQRKDEDERNRQEMGSTTAIRIMKMVNLPSPARNPDARRPYYY